MLEGWYSVANSINEAVRERRGLLQELQKALKAVDTELEVSERLLHRLRTRKRKILSESDFNAVVEGAMRIEGLFTVYAEKVKAGITIVASY